MPDRDCNLAANVPNESPPSNVGTRSVAVLIVQFAAATVSKPSPSANSLSSAMVTIVEKSCFASVPSTPLHDPRHLSSFFLHVTWSCAHAPTSYAKSCTLRPRSSKTSSLKRLHLPKSASAQRC